jgi:hypothetical protein
MMAIGAVAGSGHGPSDGRRSLWRSRAEGRGIARWPSSRPGPEGSPWSACRRDKSVGHRSSCLSPFPSLGGRTAGEGRAARAGVQGDLRRGPAPQRLGGRRGSPVRPVARRDGPRQRKHAAPAGLGVWALVVQPGPDSPAEEALFGDTCRQMRRHGEFPWPAAAPEDWTCPQEASAADALGNGDGPAVVDCSTQGALGAVMPMGLRTRLDGQSRRRPLGGQRPRRYAVWGLGRYDQGADDGD